MMKIRGRHAVILKEKLAAKVAVVAYPPQDGSEDDEEEDSESLTRSSSASLEPHSTYPSPSTSKSSSIIGACYEVIPEVLPVRDCERLGEETAKESQEAARLD